MNRTKIFFVALAYLLMFSILVALVSWLLERFLFNLIL